MKLRTLAFSNIRHNLRNYAMYFFAMCFCVFTTYTFAALSLSDNVKEKLGTDFRYQSMFVGFGIVILVFVFFFLLSSNKSFIKYRKKEISTYALFGMPNGKIGHLLFLETLMMGTAALAVGILIGIFFSKMITMVLLKMVMSSYSGNISFTLEPAAIIMTVIIYLAIFSIMGLTGRRVISRFQLVDLFKGEKMAESKSKGSYVLLILAVVLIALGYFFALSSNAGVVIIAMIFVIAVVVLGTYLFFAGGLQKILYLIKRNKRRLYNKSRLISVSLLSYKSKTMAGTMGTIAVLVAVATTAIAFGYTIYQGSEKNVYETTSFDVWYYTDDTVLDEDVHAILDEYGLKVTDEVSFQRYVSEPAPIGIQSQYSYFFDQDNYSMTYSESTYNSIVRASKGSNTPIDVEKGEVVALYPNYLDDVEVGDTVLVFGNRQYDAVFRNVMNSYSFGGMLLTLVFDDEDFNALLSVGEISTDNGGSELWPFTGINYENALSESEAAAKITQAVSPRAGSYRVAYNYYLEQISLFGLICFIGYFICAVFILMSVSMLYFKQVVIGVEEKCQYEMLRKIGISSEEERRVVRGRLIPVFFVPLALGIVHSLFAMKAADTIIFSNFIVSQGSTYLNVLLASLVMYAVYVFVYTIFYFVTKSQYKKAIR